ncbi:hypothetical protein C0995_008767 [Termitomyces sp. Mi166|nr:hypothetical protein C0995_008767 [Termitomyces sp. Mi166\
MSVGLNAAPTFSGLGLTTKNAHLKGRRRFKADLADIEQACSNRNVVEQGFRIQNLQAGDDEGTIEVTVSDLDGQHVLGFNLLISDVLESVASDSSRTIQETIQEILISLTKRQTRAVPHASGSQEVDIDEDDNSLGDYEAVDQFEEFVDGSTAGKQKLDLQNLQNDFLEVVATGYRPGILRFADDDLAISVSIPVVVLAKSIPPRALMAWDRRLLSRSQHLTLLISGFRDIYPPLDHGGAYTIQAQRSGISLSFKVGLTGKYKPGKEYAKDAGRTYGLIQTDAEDELRLQAEKAAALDDFGFDYDGDYLTEHNQAPTPVIEEHDEGSFDRFSLSSSLESLLDHSLLKLIQFRRKFGLGWAGAELLLSIIEITQTPEDRVFDMQQQYEIIRNPNTVDLLVSIAHAAAIEQVLNDPLPIGLGLRVPLPDALKLREPPRKSSSPDTSQTVLTSHETFSNRFIMRAAIAALIDTLPAIDDMKKHLERKVKAGKAKPRLKDMDPTILPAAWSIFACVASCTAYLEEITSGEEYIKNLDPGWRQFRFSVGSPDAEAKFKSAIDEAQGRSANAVRNPSLYRDLTLSDRLSTDRHSGIGVRRANAINVLQLCLPHGLWFKEIANGRAFGHGVYLAKEGNISMGTYAQPGRSTWRKSKICPTNCVALAEVVNLPHEFVSHDPHFVIGDTHWIMCRYLLVKGVIDISYETIPIPEPGKTRTVPFVELDPFHPVTLNSKRIEIPEPMHQMAVFAARQEEFREEAYDDEDTAVFEKNVISTATGEIFKDDDSDDMMDVDMDSYENSEYSRSTRSISKKFTSNFIDWKHDPEWVRRTTEHLMPPPSEASPSATMAVQMELMAMLREQQDARSLKELGWFMPPDLIADNLFQWIVEMHSFDDDLPIARDLRARNLNSVVFEIRFPPTFPIAPPFFRILTPRFLPFIQGGGGHVTAGGSICMDLLTSDGELFSFFVYLLRNHIVLVGWLLSYSIPAVLLQIKLAISNLEPRPARLASDYDRPYDMQEALTGFKKAAATNGWKVRNKHQVNNFYTSDPYLQVPLGIEKLSR